MELGQLTAFRRERTQQKFIKNLVEEVESSFLKKGTLTKYPIPWLKQNGYLTVKYCDIKILLNPEHKKTIAIFLNHTKNFNCIGNILVEKKGDVVSWDSPTPSILNLKSPNIFELGIKNISQLLDLEIGKIIKGKEIVTKLSFPPELLNKSKLVLYL